MNEIFTVAPSTMKSVKITCCKHFQVYGTYKVNKFGAHAHLSVHGAIVSLLHVDSIDLGTHADRIVFEVGLITKNATFK